MRKFSVSFVLIIIFTVFVFCFLLGKFNAAKEKEEHTDAESKTQYKTKEDVSQASIPAKHIEKENKKNEAEVNESEPEADNKKTPPDRMLFPCGQTVLKEYSQQAVYSETMDDWRAHTGIDYKADIGTEVISVWDGVVKNIYKDTLWGYTVEIEHVDNIISIYKNLDENIFVEKGENITKGQALGKVGNSANIEKREESHLHFEMNVNDMPINPSSYIY